MFRSYVRIRFGSLADQQPKTNLNTFYKEKASNAVNNSFSMVILWVLKVNYTNFTADTPS